MSAKPAFWFWIAGIAGLLWYLWGLVAVGSLLLPAAYTPGSGMTEQSPLFQGLPLWTNVLLVFAMASGILGTVLLLFRRGGASAWFWLSLGATVAHDFYWFGVHDAYGKGGPSTIVTSGLVILVLLGLLSLTRLARNRAWLR